MPLHTLLSDFRYNEMASTKHASGTGEGREQNMISPRQLGQPSQAAQALALALFGKFQLASRVSVSQTSKQGNPLRKAGSFLIPTPESFVCFGGRRPGTR
jgi:hypothetical protein